MKLDLVTFQHQVIRRQVARLDRQPKHGYRLHFSGVKVCTTRASGKLTGFIFAHYLRQSPRGLSGNMPVPPLKGPKINLLGLLPTTMRFAIFIQSAHV
jgi:hypothetical protein